MLTKETRADVETKIAALNEMPYSDYSARTTWVPLSEWLTPAQERAYKADGYYMTRQERLLLRGEPTGRAEGTAWQVANFLKSYLEEDGEPVVAQDGEILIVFELEAK